MKDLNNNERNEKKLGIAKFMKRSDFGLYDLRIINDEDYFDKEDDCGIMFFSKKGMTDFLKEEFENYKFTLVELKA